MLIVTVDSGTRIECRARDQPGLGTGTRGAYVSIPRPKLLQAGTQYSTSTMQLSTLSIRSGFNTKYRRQEQCTVPFGRGEPVYRLRKDMTG